MNKKTIILIGGNGKMGLEIQRYFKNRFHLIIFDKLKNKKNNNNIQIDLEKKLDLNKLLLKKKFQKVVAIINLVRENKIAIEDPDHYFLFYNYSIFLEKIISLNNLRNFNVLNISSINIKLISQQSYSYHFSKLNLELLTKYYSVKYLKKNIMFNDVRVGLIKTKNIDNILSKKSLSKIISLKKMLNYKKLINFLEKVYFENQILNGTCLTMDNSFSNFDQIYFNNLTKK
jgi:hypothetical protein